VTISRAGILLACALAIGVVAAPAGTAAAKAKTCKSASKARGAHVLARDHTAVVFSLRGHDYPRGCVLRSKRVFALRVCCEAMRFRLGGRYAAYIYNGSAVGDETAKIGVYDLATGKTLPITKLAPNSEGAGNEVESGGGIDPFLVTSTGALVWLQTAFANEVRPAGTPELRVIDGPQRTERILDTGAIDPKSITLTGMTLSWTKDGAPQSTQLS
jgi:hypothetical protein